MEKSDVGGGENTKDKQIRAAEWLNVKHQWGKK